MASTQTTRESYYPAISAQPTPDELARHLRMIYQALNDHDQAIVNLHTMVKGGTTTASTSSSTG